MPGGTFSLGRKFSNGSDKRGLSSSPEKAVEASLEILEICVYPVPSDLDPRSAARAEACNFFQAGFSRALHSDHICR